MDFFNMGRTLNEFYKQVIELNANICIYIYICMYVWVLVFYHLKPKDYVNTYSWIDQCSYTKKDMLQS